jgi:hypothetical protein
VILAFCDKKFNGIPVKDTGFFYYQLVISGVYYGFDELD